MSFSMDFLRNPLFISWCLLTLGEGSGAFIYTAGDQQDPRQVAEDHVTVTKGVPRSVPYLD